MSFGPRWFRLARLVLLVWFVLSPLRAVAATVPMPIAYDGLAQPTVRVEAGLSVRPDAEQAPITAYDDAPFGYDTTSRLRLANGSGAICAYDDTLEHANRRGTGTAHAYARTLEHADRREVHDKGTIYDDPTPTTAAEAGGLVRGAENIRTFDSLVNARAAARQMAGLGEDTVKYVSEVGPMKGQVVGSASADGLRGWRIDFDPTKGYHVNWWDKTGGAARSTWTYGANIINGGTEGDFLNFLQHLQ